MGSKTDSCGQKKWLEEQPILGSFDFFSRKKYILGRLVISGLKSCFLKSTQKST